MEKQNVEMIIGKKVEKSEADADKSKKIVKGMDAPPTAAEVQGRSGFEYVRDPWCGAVNFVYVDDYKYIWYRCWRCDGLFRV